MSLGKGRFTGTCVIVMFTALVILSIQSISCPRQAETELKGWPMFQHDPQHTGRSSYEGITKNPVIRWVSDGSSFAISGAGRIYVGNESWLVALNTEGLVLWSFSPTRGEFSSPPALGPNGTIYIGLENYLLAINPNGTEKWRVKIADKAYHGVKAPPVISSEGTIYITDGEHELTAINSQGKVKWSFEKIREESVPALGPTEKTIYIPGHRGDSLYAIDPNGSLKWKFSPKERGRTASTPTVGKDGTIYIGFGDDLYAITSKGTSKWVYKTGGEIGQSGASPAIGPAGTIYFGSDDAHYYALNPDGTTKWILNTQGDRVGEVSPIVGSKGIVYLSMDVKNGSYIYAINPDGTEKWRILIDQRSPSLGIGPSRTIYAVDYNLYALGTCSGDGD